MAGVGSRSLSVPDFLALYQKVQADVSQAEGKMWVQGAPRKDRHCE